MARRQTLKLPLVQKSVQPLAKGMSARRGQRARVDPDRFLPPAFRRPNYMPHRKAITSSHKAKLRVAPRAHSLLWYDRTK